ncbi:uncharacterized protein VP01_1505g2 [Puccinia sorghi]|uniref:Uncharacterized protein n=1 Tax=Puccinia sorghi TaxID=27349 RepID=A0A0L6VJ21_9BASI|nr:uncharacterized protein VP01_1505g2 [Puccinia sorghi]
MTASPTPPICPLPHFSAHTILSAAATSENHRFHLAYKDSTPDGDGKFGFRWILEAMKYGKNSWFWVWQAIISNVKVSGINTKIDPSKYLIKMDHGKSIVNTFKSPVVFLSMEEFSFIPTTTASTNRSKPIPPFIGSKLFTSQFKRSWRSELMEFCT